MHRSAGAKQPEPRAGLEHVGHDEVVRGNARLEHGGVPGEGLAVQPGAAPHPDDGGPREGVLGRERAERALGVAERAAPGVEHGELGADVGVAAVAGPALDGGGVHLPPRAEAPRRDAALQEGRVRLRADRDHRGGARVALGAGDEGEGVAEGAPASASRPALLGERGERGVERGGGGGRGLVRFGRVASGGKREGERERRHGRVGKRKRDPRMWKIRRVRAVRWSFHLLVGLTGLILTRPFIEPPFFNDPWAYLGLYLLGPLLGLHFGRPVQRTMVVDTGGVLFSKYENDDED